MPKFVVVLLLLLSPAVFAQLSFLDDGLSPSERFASGSNISGSYDAQSLLYCSPSARAKYIPEVVDNNTVLHTYDNGFSIVVTDQLAQINNLINRTLKTLSNDLYVQSRSLCTGFYFEESSHVGNALSMGLGYLIFDYRLFQHLFSLPDDKRSSWVYEFIVLHEFAHQLQYWNNDVEVINTMNGLQNSRTPELAADCTAGALLRLQNLNLSDDLYDISFNGVLGAAEALGDYDKEAAGHHGTPEERMAAAAYGSQMVKSLKVSLSLGLTQLTSADILKSCNTYVKTH